MSLSGLIRFNESVKPSTHLLDYLLYVIISFLDGMSHTKGNQVKKSAKTLGPVSAELLLCLSAKGKTIFSVADAQAVTGKSYKATAALLGELVRRRWLVRLVPGLITYVQRLDHKAAVKRVGFLLETYGLARPETIAALQSHVNPRYALLDPMLPDSGPYRVRWRLRINLDPEELKTIVWT